MDLVPRDNFIFQLLEHIFFPPPLADPLLIIRTILLTFDTSKIEATAIKEDEKSYCIFVNRKNFLSGKYCQLVTNVIGNISLEERFAYNKICKCFSLNNVQYTFVFVPRMRCIDNYSYAKKIWFLNNKVKVYIKGSCLVPIFPLSFGKMKSLKILSVNKILQSIAFWVTCK